MGDRKRQVSPCPLDTDVKSVTPVSGSVFTSLHCPQLGPVYPAKQSHTPPIPDRHTPAKRNTPVAGTNHGRGERIYS
eukprot:9484229-Pyramimonas_sp.AAC.1